MRTVDEWKALLRDGILAARKARDPIRAAAFKETLAAIEDAAAPPLEAAPAATEGVIAGTAGGLYAGEVARRHLTPDEARAVIARVGDERHAMADEFESHGRAEHAASLRAEAAILRSLLDDVAAQ